MSSSSVIQNNFTLSSGDSTLVSLAGYDTGMDITIQNLSSGYVYLGTSNVTTSSFGYRIPVNGAWSVKLKGNDDLYAIAQNDNSEICVLMVGA
jgi:hypothetical protein